MPPTEIDRVIVDGGPPPAVTLEVKELTAEYKRVTTLKINTVEAAISFLNDVVRSNTLTENLKASEGLLFAIVLGVLVVSVAFILAGIALVYLGATGASEINIFGQSIKSANVGIVSIALGAVVMVLLLRNVMRTLLGVIQNR